MNKFKYNLADFISTLKDPRRGQGQRHKFEDVILIIIMAIISGEQGIRGFERFASVNKAELTKILNLKHGVPSFQTFQNLFSELNAQHVSEEFLKWMKKSHPQLDDKFIALDGKAISSTYSGKQTEKQNFIMIVNAFGHQSGVVYGMQPFQNKKAAESSHLRQLIVDLGCINKVYTADALHCEKKL
jgi:hypothetical protein